MIKRTFIYLSIFLVFTSPLFSSQTSLFEKIQVEDGYSTGTVYCILQDHDGFLWIGTSTGLKKYDGYTLLTYRHDPNDPESISGNTIRSIVEDDNHNLWIGTSSQGINKYDHTSDGFKHYYFTQKDSTTTRTHITNSLQSKNSDKLYAAIWEMGLVSINVKDGRKKVLNDDQVTTRFPALRSIKTIKISENHQNLIWVGTRRGLFSYNVSSEKWQQIPIRFYNHKNVEDWFIYAIAEDKNGYLWIGGNPGALCKYDPSSNQILEFYPDIESVSTIHIDLNERIWIGTYGSGLIRMDNDYSSPHYYHQPGDLSDIYPTHIVSLYSDSDGIIWIGVVGTDLVKFNPGKPFFNNILHKFNLRGLTISSLHTDKKDIIWIGAASGQVYNYNPEQGMVDLLWQDQQNSKIQALCRDDFDNLWIGTFGNGLIRYNLQSGQYQLFRYNKNVPQGLQGDRITSLLHDSKGRLWIGTDGSGLHLWSREKQNFINYGMSPSDSGLNSVYIWSLLEDQSGMIWIGTWDNGVIKYDPEKKIFSDYRYNKNDSTSISGPYVVSMAQDNDGTIWFGTWGYGLSRLDSQHNSKNISFERIIPDRNIPIDYVLGIIPDKKGRIWLSTLNGIVRYDPQSGQFDHFEESNGLKSLEFCLGSVSLSSEEKLFFGGINGLYSRQVKDDIIDLVSPQIELTTVKLFDENLLIQKFDHNTDYNKVMLPYDKNYLGFEFAVLDYSDPRKNKYKYKMAGVDSKWISSGTRRYVYYADLAPGEYTFMVKGANSSNVWNETGVKLPLIIYPPFWKTWWAFSFYLLSLVGLLMLIRNIEIKRKERQQKEIIDQASLREAKLKASTAEIRTKSIEVQKEIEKQEIRTRIARDLHDEIGSNLSSIVLISDLMQKDSNPREKSYKILKQIHQVARESTEAIREIVWFMNASSDSVVDLIAKMNEMTEVMLQEKKYSFNRKSKFPMLLLQPTLKKNIYLIFKEALNNILKHSEATEIIIEVSLEDNQFMVKIEDNGIGFSTENTSAGHGLLNMRFRATEMSGNLILNSRQGEGTDILLEVNIT